MPPEASAFLAGLPPWAQIGANVALFLLTIAAGVWGIRKGHKDEGEKESEPFHASDLLDSSPVKRMLETWETVADNARLQTEALKTISAAAVAMAKTIEADFDERRIQSEVKRRLDLEQRGRSERA